MVSAKQIFEEPLFVRERGGYSTHFRLFPKIKRERVGCCYVVDAVFGWLLLVFLELLVLLLNAALHAVVRFDV